MYVISPKNGLMCCDSSLIVTLVSGIIFVVDSTVVIFWKIGLSLSCLSITQSACLFFNNEGVVWDTILAFNSCRNSLCACLVSRCIL